MKNEDTNTNEPVHIPVLLQEVLEHLDLHLGDVVFDGTYGTGGYTKAILEKTGPQGSSFATDQDQVVVERSQKDLDSRITLFHSNFSEIDSHTDQLFDGMVLDLGISSDQLEDRNRGISFKHTDAPLDMRMNASEDNHLTAWGVLHSWEESEIADAIYKYADERYSRRIARAIVARRSENKLETVGDLIETIESVVRRSGRIHPATKTFQALRIVVNDEIGHLERFLEKAPTLVKPGARLVVVSFHSLEERVVKHAFRTFEQAGLGSRGVKKSLAPTREELVINPRARSARLRSFIFN